MLASKKADAAAATGEEPEDAQHQTDGEHGAAFLRHFPVAHLHGIDDPECQTDDAKDKGTGKYQTQDPHH